MEVDVHTPKKLAWGETPFDDMDRDELLDWSKRMLDACTVARVTFSALRDGWATTTDPYWNHTGTGGKAFAKVKLVVVNSAGYHTADAKRSTLLDAARRLYAACPSARSALVILRASMPSLSFWSQGRTGATALARLDAIVEEIERRFDSESIYRSFYRYANDLYFGPELGLGWHICQVDGCDVMVGHSGGSQLPPRCLRHGEGKMRPITWDDLKPLAAV